MKVGLVCYPTYGGSGIVATELGLALARERHEVHLFSYAPPSRLTGPHPGVTFHQVEAFSYPLFPHPYYTLDLTSKIVEVARRTGLEIVHAHYAVPHAVSALLAREILEGKVRVVTTLHGTDITLVGSDPTFHPVTRWSLERSDAVTAVSRYLADETCRQFGLCGSIEVIPNFVDTDLFRPGGPGQAPRAPEEGPLLAHVSNFRDVKRPLDVVRILARLRGDGVAARLVLAGEGPLLARTLQEAERLGCAAAVTSLGHLDDVAGLLAGADLFLLPSESESFGLAALEALACGTPVVASRAGGLPEVVDDACGALLPVGDLDGMARACAGILSDPARHAAMRRAARARAVERFPLAAGVRAYVDLYRRVLARTA